jgi:hypothetical protein
MIPAKVCLFCLKPLRGRSDKKYCNDHCRSAYHHGLKGTRDLTEIEKIRRFDRIKELLDSLDRDAQRLIVWSHLTYLVALDRKNLPWILEHLDILIQTESAKLMGGFHS